MPPTEQETRQNESLPYRRGHSIRHNRATTCAIAKPDKYHPGPTDPGLHQRTRTGLACGDRPLSHCTGDRSARPDDLLFRQQQSGLFADPIGALRRKPKNTARRPSRSTVEDTTRTRTWGWFKRGKAAGWMPPSASPRPTGAIRATPGHGGILSNCWPQDRNCWGSERGLRGEVDALRALLDGRGARTH